MALFLANFKSNFNFHMDILLRAMVENMAMVRITKVLGIGKTPPPPMLGKFPNNPVSFF